MSQGSGGWYVRARGRTLGPFSWAQLESLRDRGQLAQFHELSQDKRTWVHASTLTELFVDSPRRDQSSQVYGLKNAPPLGTRPRDGSMQRRLGSHGPCSAEQIVALVRSGQIVADTPDMEARPPQLADAT